MRLCDLPQLSGGTPHCSSNAGWGNAVWLYARGNRILSSIVCIKDIFLNAAIYRQSTRPLIVIVRTKIASYCTWPILGPPRRYFLCGSFSSFIFSKIVEMLYLLHQRGSLITCCIDSSHKKEMYSIPQAMHQYRAFLLGCPWRCSGDI